MPRPCFAARDRVDRGEARRLERKASVQGQMQSQSVTHWHKKTVPDPDLVPVPRDLASRSINQELVVGLGPGLVQGLGQSVEGLRAFPNLSGPGREVPST